MPAIQCCWKRLGFLDTRGTLFFEIERIIHEFTQRGQKPAGFILENVEGLMKHGGEVKGSPYGKTLTTIVTKLELAGYNVEVLLLDSADFGLAQSRKRVYILGIDKTRGKIDVKDLPHSSKKFGEVKESGLPTDNGDFAKHCSNITNLKKLKANISRTSVVVQGTYIVGILSYEEK